ncbi:MULTISPECIES: hypothetical protein [Mycobacterium]|uniref:hypothetical protein n=1 Tax=Mycobacterium TaxID=1763 RepID=UPI000BAABFE3|nr:MULTISPECIES: hypothetical protein [Mycobacterium]ASW85335.1 hypothetical protein CKJ61_10785 [Mycobacterium intracellulare]UQB94378.1 hypothetical protein KN252_10925 [Mycobacterium intracellulare]WSE44898.1 hypothetical protein QGN30_17170 [Mycobacterium sp. 3-98]
MRKANRAFLTQAAPVASATNSPAGLPSQSLTAGTGDIVTAENLDAVVAAVANVDTDGGQATHILAHPPD